MADLKDFTTAAGKGGRNTSASAEKQHARCRGASHDGSGHSYRGQSKQPAFRGARPDAAGRFRATREDLSLRPRTHPRADRPRPWQRRAWLLRDVRITRRADTSRPVHKAKQKTPVFVRFSTVAGGAGSVDTPRDVRGFAVKFYTQEGNWDLVGNNIPVFFIQDAIKFPDLIHAVKMEADRAFPQAGERARHILGLRLAHARDDAHAHVGRCPIGRHAAVPCE